MNFSLRLIFTLLVLPALISCSNTTETNIEKLSQEEVTEKLLDANKTAIIAENDQIEKIIMRNGWKMLETGTGLRYQFIEKGNGPKAISGKYVKFEYEVRLIYNEIIYSSEQTGPKEFKVGSGGVESGLEEGILLLRVGDKVRFIIPSYLAHGLSGDQDKIPPKATLIYTLELISVK